MRQRLGWSVLLGIALLAGCGTESGGGSTAAAPEAESIKRRTAESLPKVDEYLAPLGPGQIEVAPPINWKLLPRSGKWLVGFAQGKTNDLPRITVADDEAAAGETDTTEDNAPALASRLAGELASANRQVEEPPMPIILGDTVYVRHVRLARHSGAPAVIQSLQTVQDGRLYTVELFCEVDAASEREYEASLTKWRDVAYAVAANIKFGATSEAAEIAGEKIAGESPTDDKADEKSADDAAKPVDEEAKPKAAEADSKASEGP